MRFGVVVCTGCRRARGMELAAKTTACPRCGKRQQTKDLRVFFRADDAGMLQRAVGAVEELLAAGDLGLITDQARFEADIAARLTEQARTATGRQPGPPPADEAAATGWAASHAVGAQGDQVRATRILIALDAALPEGFTPEQLSDAFVAAGLPAERAEKEIRRALVRDEIYEPRPGVLKRLQ